MLVLQLKLSETLFVGDDIEIQVVQVRHNLGAVRLGITAPTDIPIHRKVVREAKLAGAQTLSQRRKSSDARMP